MGGGHGVRVVGVDAGGTFTDTVVIDERGQIAVGKALSTPEAPERGVIASLRAAATSVDLDLGALLTGTAALAHGTTVGLNALLTGAGARVGLVTTAGFESTLPMARANKLHGLSSDDLRVPSCWVKPPLLVPRRRIVGVRERIDRDGGVITPPDDADIDTAVARLLDDGVDSVAVTLLWSPVNPAHERRVAERIHAVAPHVHVSISSDLAARVGEYERTTTTVIDAYVAPLMSHYLERLDEALRAEGFAGQLLMMRMGGGVQSLELARRQPVTTLQSGPIGGVGAARELVRDTPDVVTADVGGTSFDVGLVIGGQVQFAARPTISRLPLAMPVVDVTSIGVGGGSIAWVDEALGVLRVGPRSAGADPGPACYGRGGTEPTLTDAAVVLGYVAHLGGRFTLDATAARNVIEPLATRLGLSIAEVADGIVTVAAEQMRQLVRRVVVERGYDPGDFVLCAFGGAGGQYVARYARELGVAGVVIPRLAPEFSALGAATGDLRTSAERDLAPGSPEDRVAAAADLLDELERTARAQSGLPGEMEVERTVALRYFRQTTRIDVPLTTPTLTLDALPALRDEFHRRYEAVVGPGTSRPDTPLELVAARVQVSAGGRPAGRLATSGTNAMLGQRPIIFDGAARDVPVYDWDTLAAGWRTAGPTVVESPRTAVVVPPGAAVRADDDANLWLEWT